MGGFRTGLLIGGLAVAVIALTVALIANSGGDGDGTTTTTNSVVLDDAGTQTVATTTSTATAPGTTTTPPSGTSEVKFATPSRNIACRVTRESATCGVLEFTFKPPPDTAGCGPERWGHAFTVGITGPGSPICANDPPAEFTSRRLPYGTRLTLGPFHCDSTKIGLLCATRDTGHGFAVSRERYGLF